MRTIPIVLVAAALSLAAACGSSQQTASVTGGDASADGDDGGGGGNDASTGGDASTGHDGSNGHDSSTGTDAPAGMDAPSGNDSSSGADGGDAATTTDSGGNDAPADTAAGETSTGTDASEAGSVCGTCATGFSCGPSGYCVDSAGVPQFGHVYVIVMENHSLSSIQGDSKATYINGTLLTTYAYATNYTTANHPSLPNYIDLTSGGTQGIACDCSPGAPATCTGLTCNLFSSSCNCGGISATHIGDQLDAAGIAWRDYGQSMGTACNFANPGANSYAAKHVPFLYYADVGGNPTTCANRVVDYSNFAGDLAAGSVRYAFIAPDLCNDMHDSCAPDNEPIQQGDQWLAANVPPIVAKMTGTDVLFIVWDEQDTLGAVEIPLIVVSPIAKAGPTGKAYTHESLLGTIEEGLGLSPKLGGAATAAVIDDVWK